MMVILQVMCSINWEQYHTKLMMIIMIMIMILQVMRSVNWEQHHTQRRAHKCQHSKSRHSVSGDDLMLTCLSMAQRIVVLMIIDHGDKEVVRESSVIC